MKLYWVVKSYKGPICVVITCWVCFPRGVHHGLGSRRVPLNEEEGSGGPSIERTRKNGWVFS